ncbi:MAG: flagellar hook-basal body protein [candidate division KSB1 bacterium]|nr:flagellar hook-basal body protein [candidate division KSB1 bacterium]
MLRGIYTAAVGMMARQRQQDIISNNLANVNTAGFKFDRLYFRNTMDAASLINGDPQNAPVEEFRTDFSQGRLYKTGSLLDFAIEGDGFFVVEGPNGPLYTRNGHFIINDSRELLTANGLPVMGENGPIVLPDGDFSVNHRGEILNQDNEVINRFVVAQFGDPKAALMKVGNNLYFSAWEYARAGNG